MRKIIHQTVLICVCLIQSGCVVPQAVSNSKSPDGNNLWGESWERTWADESDRETPYRSYGGVI